MNTTPSIRAFSRHALASLAALLLAAAQPSLAVDSDPPAKDKLAAARAEIQAGRWAAAIQALKQVNDTSSADWNNLMGYSHRKAKSPDYAAAERYYDDALRIDPQHRGALEYSGELYLMLGELPKAEARLAALDKACLLPCAEYTELKNAIARYKASGGKSAGSWAP
ncbi:MAG: tetratricopeptide repeat protein [Burkholderiales bacterium]|nr:tetratricopeptide repeat protein [Burkholderiales bacterium]